MDFDPVERKELTLLILQDIFKEALKQEGKSKRGGVRNHNRQQEWSRILMYQTMQPTVAINTTGEDFVEGEDDIYIGITVIDQFDMEKAIIKHDFFLQMSIEARFIVSCIYLHRPEILTTKGTFSIPGFNSFLNQKGWGKETLKRVKTELKEFVECF